MKKFVALIFILILTLSLFGCGKCKHELETVITPPTCTDGGYTTQVCKKCGASEITETTDAHGHTYGDWRVAKTIMPDDTEGTKQAGCVNCNDFKTAPLNIITEGALGSSVKYTLFEDGTLLLTGSGANADCGWNGSAQPYADYREKVTRAVIGEGITELVGGVFAYMPNLTECEMPSTLKKIGNNAFMDSFTKDVTEFTFPESVEHIGICVIGAFRGGEAIFTDVYIENPNATLVRNDQYIPFNSYVSSCTGLTVYSYGTSNKVRSFAEANGIRYFDLNSSVKGTSGNLAYEFFDGTLTLSSVDPTAQTQLPAALFELIKIDRAGVKKLVITAGITEIPDEYFKDCTSLTEVLMPSSLKNVGAEALATSTACGTGLTVSFEKGLSELSSDFLKNRSNVKINGYGGGALDGFSVHGAEVTLKNSLKILLIGNSLSLDAADYLNETRPSQLYNIIKSMTGDNTFVEIAVLYNGAKTAGWHATVAESGASAYQFYIIGDSTGGKWKGYNGYTAKQGLLYDDWDIITIQPYASEAQSGTGAVSDTDTNPEKSTPVKAEKFYPLSSSLPYLLDFINEHRPSAKVYYYLTWSNSVTPALNQNKAGYETMIGVAKTAVNYKGTQSGKGFDGIIPVGTSIQNARSTFLALTSYTSPDGNTNYDERSLQRDGVHLSVEVGRYIAGLSFAEILVPTSYRLPSYELPQVSSAAIGSHTKEYTKAAILSVQKMLESLAAGANQYAPTEISGYTQLPN